MSIRRGRRSKYAAVPVVREGIRFASQREARRFGELRLLQAAGQIRDLECQPVFRLHAIDLPSGEVTYIGDYRGDYRYLDTATGETIVEDVKGMKTLPLSRWKQKHVRGEYGITVKEIR